MDFCRLKKYHEAIPLSHMPVFHSLPHPETLQHNAICYTTASPVQIVRGNMPVVVRHHIAVVHCELTAWKLGGGFCHAVILNSMETLGILFKSNADMFQMHAIQAINSIAPPCLYYQSNGHLAESQPAVFSLLIL